MLNGNGRTQQETLQQLATRHADALACLSIKNKLEERQKIY